VRTGTHLKTKRDNNAEDDFASFNDFDQEDLKGQELAREFYQELESRQGQSSSEYNPRGNDDETYTVNDRGGKNKQNTDGNQNTIKTVTIRANGNNASSTSSSRRAFTNTNQPTNTSSQQSSPVFPLFPFISFPTPAPRPATSAGLFSGSGTTVYSSGRSIRAEIEILETTLKNNDAKNNKQGWDPEQTEEVFRLAVVSLIVLSAAYIAVEASGGMAVISWDGAAASASSIMVSVGNGDVFMGEEAAWLMKESSGLAASVVEAVRSVEALVLI